MENQTLTEIRTKRVIAFIRLLKEYNCYIEALAGFDIYREKYIPPNTLTIDFFTWIMKKPKWSYMYNLSTLFNMLKKSVYDEKWFDELTTKYYLYLKTERNLRT